MKVKVDYFGRNRKDEELGEWIVTIAHIAPSLDDCILKAIRFESPLLAYTWAVDYAKGWVDTCGEDTQLLDILKICDALEILVGLWGEDRIMM